MKINHVISEHKKGIKAVKYNKKPQDPTAAHAKAKEKLAPVKPLEEMRSRRDAYQRDYDNSTSGFGNRRNPAEDESNLLYIYKDGRLHQSMISNYNEREARAQGFRDTPEQALKMHGIIRSKFNADKFVKNIGGKWVEVHPFGKGTEPEMDEAQGDPIGTVQSATPDGKVVIKTDNGVVNTDKDALMPGATPQDPLQMKPDAAGGALKPGAKVVSTAEDILPPPADSQSPIHGGTVHSDDGHGDDDHNEIIQLLKRLAHRDGIDEAETPPAPSQPAAAPGSDIDPGEHILDVKTTPEIDAYIEANTVRDADGDVDFAGTMGKVMSGATEKMDIKGLQDAVVQMEAKFKAFPSSPEFKAMSPQEQQEWTQAAPEALKVMQDVAAQMVKMAQAFDAGGKQITDFSKSADYQNPLKGVKSFPPQQVAPAPTTEDTQLLQKMLTIAGLR
jgi:hypothetical protein